MHSLQLDFNKINYYNKLNFKLKNEKLLNNISIKYYIKKNVSSKKKRLKNNFYKLFKQFENLSGLLPKIYKINLKYTNKKKKLKTRVFIKIILNLNRDVLNSFDILFVKHFYMYINTLEKLKFKKFAYLEEIVKNKVNLKISIGINFLIFNALILKNVFDFGKEIFVNKSSNYIKAKKYKMIFLKMNIKSNNIIFFFKFITFFILNNYKINLYFYKKFLDRKDF